MSSIDSTQTAWKTLNREARIRVESWHRLCFTRDVFDPENPVLSELLEKSETVPAKCVFILDRGFEEACPGIRKAIENYGKVCEGIFRFERIRTIPGGEEAKNNGEVFESLVKTFDEIGLCRRSFVITVGGGAVLDVAGFAASTVHRGIKLIRLPTTTLAQADSGVGVKNGINRFGKKNFLGTFNIPFGVINDESFPTTLSDRDWRCGFSEAVKVALVRDRPFFDELEAKADRLRERSFEDAVPVIRHCAELHFRHIVEGGDPFELAVARPLDFGHWAAHKIEQLTDYRLAHGEAVAVGVALDTLYSAVRGYLPWPEAERILTCLNRLGFTLYDDSMNDTETLFEGLEEFRQHLGGRLAITLLRQIGDPFDAHEIDGEGMRKALAHLSGREARPEI